MNNERIKTVEEIEEMIRNDFYDLFYEREKMIFDFKDAIDVNVDKAKLAIDIACLTHTIKTLESLLFKIKREYKAAQ